MEASKWNSLILHRHLTMSYQRIFAIAQDFQNEMRYILAFFLAVAVAGANPIVVQDTAYVR